MFATKSHGNLCALALAVSMALGLTGCGGGGGANIKPTPPPSDPPPAPTSNGPPTVLTGNYIAKFDDSTKTWSQDVKGSGSLTKDGTGTLVITGTDTWTGGTTIDDGTLQIGDGGTSGSIIGNVKDNASLAFKRSDQVKFGGIISGTGTLTQAGKGTLILTGANTYTGGTTIKAGTLQVGNGGKKGSLVGNVLDNGALVFDRSDKVKFDDVISGTGTLTQAGKGTLILTGANTYTGGTTIKAGILQVGNGGKSGSLAGNVLNNGILAFDRSDQVTYAGVISGSGSLQQRGKGTLILTGANTYTGGTTIKAGTLQIGNGNANGSIVGNVMDNGTLAFGSFSDTTYSGIISGTGKLITIDNTGRLTLLGKNTYSGGTTVTGLNVVRLGNGGTKGSITGDVDLNGTLIFDHSNAVVFGGSVSGTGDLENSGTGKLVLTGKNPLTGRVLIEPGSTVQIGNGGTTGSLSDSVSVLDQGTLVFNRSDNVTWGGGIYSVMNGTPKPGSVVKDGSGMLTLTNTLNGGVFSYKGPTVINSGILRFGDGTRSTKGVLPPGNVVIKKDAVLELYQGKPGSNPILYYTATGDISGAGSMVVSGIVGLSGDSTYSGGTTIKPQSTLIASQSGSALGSGPVLDNGTLHFNFDDNATVANDISGSGGVMKVSSGVLTLTGHNTYTGLTEVHGGTLRTTQPIPGSVLVDANSDDPSTLDAVPEIKGSLTNNGTVAVHGGNTKVDGNYSQWSTGTLAVSLGSKLDVTGTATLHGGTLEVTGADSGYTANKHTDVLTAAGGISGTFDKLVKDKGVVFTSTKIGYGANDVYLDTSGLKVTTAAAGQGVGYTPASYGSAVRVQSAFDTLNTKINHDDLDSVSSAFVSNAGAFQHSPSYRMAQASLESLSGQLHAASAGMTLQAIDATGRALSNRLAQWNGQGGKHPVWMRRLDLGGNMSRSGFADVDYQLNGWLVGTNVRLGPHALAGFAFSQGHGIEQLSGRFDRNRGRNTAGMFYAGWAASRWYAHGRIGMGHYHQHMSRLLLLGRSYQGVWSDYEGHYNVAYGESGLHLGVGMMQLTPFVDLEYDRVARNGFAEHGAGGFGLKSHTNIISRWQGGAGLKLARRWHFAGGGSVSLDARVQWRQTLSAHGTVFEASFVGLDAWRPLTGVGLSRHNVAFGLGLNARPSTDTRFKLGYEYLAGDRGRSGVANASFAWRF